MQELLLVTNRQRRWRVTTFGAVLIGLLAGASVAGTAGWIYAERLQTVALAREAALKAPVEAKMAELAGLGATLKAKESALSGEPVSLLVLQHESDLVHLQQLVARFPTFKTETFKQPFVDLRAEVDRQTSTMRDLHQALSSSTLGKNAKCSLSSGVGSAPLWQKDGLGLYADGWRGAVK